ncbi:MAG: hypothetical protein M3R15_25215 [Acidobacteriota bacterium]|nr:hypothetical protein [Acidobacteriota bacterium]
MKSAFFSLEAIEGRFEGYTQGESWNGWACPYFDSEQAKRIVKAWKASGMNAQYHEAKDAFEFEVSQDLDRSERSLSPI